MNDHLVKVALALLKQEFPTAKLWSASVAVSACERLDLKEPESRSEMSWQVQVGSEHGRGSTLDEALEELRQRLEFAATVPAHAERLAAVLREVPEEGFQREFVKQAAYELLRKEDEAARQLKWAEELKRSREASGQ